MIRPIQMCSIFLLFALSSSVAFAAPAPESSAGATSSAMKAPPKVIPPAPFFPPVPRRIKFPTGMMVAFVPRDGTRLLDLVLTFRHSGGAFERGPRGATSMAADLLLDGTAEKDATELANAIALLGARISADCGALACRVRAHAPVHRAQEVMALVFEIAGQPRFDVPDLERLKTEKAAAFAAQADDPKAISRIAVRRIHYGDHPLAFDVEGTKESVATLTRADIVTAWKGSFVKSNAVLTIAADANVIDMLKLVVKTSPRLPAHPMPMTTKLPVVAPMASSAGVIVIDKPGAAQSVVVVAGRGPADIAPLTPNVEAFETLFGGSFTSRLNQNLREKNGYAYGAGFSVSIIDSVRPWRVSTSVATKDTGPAIAEIAKELARIEEPATAEEILRAKTYRALTFPDAFSTGSAIVGFSVWADRVGLTSSRMGEYTAGLLAVDATAVASAARRVLRASPRVYVIVGDRAKIEPALKIAVREQKLGTIEFRTIADVVNGQR